MIQSEIVAGLDIGSTKIACIVGRKNEYGKVEILGLGRSDSLGVNRGVVENIQNTVDSINKAVAEASHNSGVDIKVVNVGIAGQHIRSLQHRGSIMRNSIEDEIEHDDVSNLIENMYKLVLPPGEEIIHVIPQEYIIDNQQRTRQPIGMSGILLEANFHIITGQVAAAKNIEKCVKKAGLEISSMILEPLASAEAVLSSEEKEAGVALVDIGGGTTDIAIFQDDIIRHTAVIPLGGNVITDDVKEGCSIIRVQAEELKKRFGSALASENKDEEVVSIPGLKGRSAKEISLRNLAHIIQARMEEIIEHVLYEIKNSGFEKKLIAGIVLTGGGSQLRHAAQLTEFITGMDTRIGYPNEHLAKSLSGETGSPMHATGIGLVIKGLDNKEIKKKRQTSKAPKTSIGAGFFSKIFNQGIDFFEKDQSV
ncbi:MAG: cell division protein FtsA [Bacteroidales bacterium]|jgi:cell division protein FtsA|nr:cell division protein FtsA [Bacteroidales bacterium]NLM92393.1 cell division protein FtsA [Bacteroidales bacterium]